MSFSHLARYAIGLTPRAAIRKAAGYAARIVIARWREAWLRNSETYAPLENNPPALKRLLGSIEVMPPGRPLKAVCEDVMAHRFDLLGSGPTEVAAEPDVAALSPGNRRRAAAIRSLIEPGYRPIDWSIDFKSGYRWRADRLSGSLAYGHRPGVDVKVPWELARCQHLPWLAGLNLVEPSPRWAAEFVNQVLDFAAANPPGYGVNWMCAMDVAIRAANMLLAHDLLRSAGVEFEPPFEAEFHSLMVAHGRHIFANLEDSGGIRCNHYLADITGLLVIAAYLPPTAEVERWLGFSCERLVIEVERQFTADGANFEASTSYHRLSAEMVIYATALLLRLDRQTPLPDWYRRRLQGMAEFSVHASKPNGRVVQVGDNDSGRFFNLLPSPDLDHRAMVAAINGLFGRADLAAFAGPDKAFESHLVSRLAGGETLAGRQAAPPPTEIYGPAVSQRIIADIIIEPPDASVLDRLEAFSYPDFGLYGWRSERFFLSVRCGPVGQNGNGGHAHNDQLAVELNIDGEDWVADPGTGVYTAWPQVRDAYRSAGAHFVPAKDYGEPASLKLGLFRLQDRARAQCLTFSGPVFEGRHGGYGKPLHRRVVIGGGRIRITDGFAGDGGQAAPPEVFRDGATLRRRFGLELAFSPGYGVFEKS